MSKADKEKESIVARVVPVDASKTLISMAVTSAAEYFLGDAKPEERDAWRQEISEFSAARPHDGPLIVIAGLLATGFEIEVDPVKVVPPQQPPFEALDTELYMANWHNIAPTVFDMGELATCRDDPRFNETITRFVERNVGLVAHV